MKQARRPHEWLDFKKTLSEAAHKRVTTGEHTYWPLLDIMLTDPHTLDLIQRHHQKHDHYVSDYDLESAETCLRFKPEKVAHMISPRPVLVVYVPRMTARCRRKSSSVVSSRLGEPKKLVKLPNAQHYESYYFCSPEMHEIGMSDSRGVVRQIPMTGETEYDA